MDLREHISSLQLKHQAVIHRQSSELAIRSRHCRELHCYCCAFPEIEELNGVVDEIRRRELATVVFSRSAPPHLCGFAAQA
jgi:hypothetical protein